MSIIGVITDLDKKYELKKGIKKYIKKDENLIVYIRQENIRNVRNIKFNTILITVEYLDKKKFEIYKKIIKATKYIIINSKVLKDKEIYEYLKKNKIKFITYGNEENCDVSISSVSKDSVIINISNNIEKIISNCEENEIKIIFRHKEVDNNLIIQALELVSLLLIYENKIKIIL